MSKRRKFIAAGAIAPFALAAIFSIQSAQLQFLVENPSN
jgi:hypothetical protein